MEQKLVSKLARIMGEITHIEKKGWNDFHKYHYVLEQDVLDVIRKKLIDYGIFIKTDIVSVSVLEMTKGGNLTTIQAKHTLIDYVTGETLEVMAAGQGEDKGDKGIYKAITGDIKYFLTKLFLVPTGNDPESFNEKRESAGRAPKQAARNPVAQAMPQAPKQAQPAQKPEINPNLPPNPWVGKLVSISVPTTGENPKTKAKWTKWEIETKGHNGKPFNLSIFSSSVAEVAADAVSNDLQVEIVWKTKKDAQGKDWNTVEGISLTKGAL
jgi:hypothetical protein